MKSEYLTKQKRNEILKSLTTQQRQVLQEYKKYRINSELLTKINQKGSSFEFIEKKTYYAYDISHPTKSPLQCDCGKHVKYLYIFKIKDTKKLIRLGSTHLKQESEIPNNILNSISKEEHVIDIGIDIILNKIAQGTNFPYLDYAYLVNKQLLRKIKEENNLTFKRLMQFRKVNLPVYDEDLQLIQKIIEKDTFKKEILNKELRAAKRHAEVKKLKKLLKQNFKSLNKTNLIQAYNLNKNNIIELVAYMVISNSTSIIEDDNYKKTVKYFDKYPELYIEAVNQNSTINRLNLKEHIYQVFYKYYKILTCDMWNW